MRKDGDVSELRIGDSGIGVDVVLAERVLVDRQIQDHRALLQGFHAEVGEELEEGGELEDVDAQLVEYTRSHTQNYAQLVVGSVIVIRQQIRHRCHDIDRIVIVTQAGTSHQRGPALTAETAEVRFNTSGAKTAALEHAASGNARNVLC